MSLISLEKMQFYAYHGCFKEENIIGNRFEVSLQVETDTAKVESSDRVEDTVNYAVLYKIVDKEMRITSKTIEHVAARILNRIQAEFPQIKHATVKVSKLNPTVGGEVGHSSVTLSA
jgi:dihydroneopterin aldolase